MEGGVEGSHQRPKMGKPRNPSTSSTNDSVPKLPEELITAILVRLPVKSLLRFKSVCKDLFALISSTHFVKTHLSFSANDFTRHRLLLQIEEYRPPKRSHRHCSVSSLFYDSVTHTFDLDCPIKNPQSVAYIVGSVNGLICYLIVCLLDLVLWNPSTRKFKKVPLLRPKKTSCCGISYGFGYDEVRDDYKVVAIFRVIDTRYYDARIYSLKSDSWRKLDIYQGKMVDNSLGVLVNGKLHWLTTIVDGGWRIMSIDLVDEKCRKVKQPCYRQEYSHLELGVLGSNLSVLGTRERSDVWVMKEYGVKESWTKLYSLDDRVISPPICISIEGEVLHAHHSSLKIYNPEDDLMRYPEVTNVDIDVTSVDGYAHLEAKLYIESLVCPVLQNEPTTQP